MDIQATGDGRYLKIFPTLPQGKYRPDLSPKHRRCHGFTIIAKIIPGRDAGFLRVCCKPSRKQWRPCRTVLAH